MKCNLQMGAAGLNCAARSSWCVAVLLLALCANGCSIRRLAVNQMGNALAQSGSVFSSDDDPELIRQAVPFSLKLMEALLAENPRHTGLLLAACRGFTQYSYAFVQADAEEMQDRDMAASEAGRLRACRLYLRARNYGLRGLEVQYAGWDSALRKNAQQAVQRLRHRDLPLIYWTAASWSAALSQAKDNPDLLADLPLIEALVGRALQLDPDFDDGALQSFMISFEFARKNAPGDPFQRAKQHFDAALALSHEQSASPLVAYAEMVSVTKQNLTEFKSLLERALAINADARPEWRLENLIMQHRARWLLSRADELILPQKPAPQTAQ
jgi:predicted anti-sigma-YlaC factor YlaD